MTETIEIGESTKRKIEVRTAAGALEDPTTMTISIWKPDGTLDIDAVAMTNYGTGLFYYWYTVSDQVGTYKILYEATTGGKVSKKRDEFDAVGLHLELGNTSDVGRSRLNDYLKVDPDRFPELFLVFPELCH